MRPRRHAARRCRFLTDFSRATAQESIHASLDDHAHPTRMSLPEPRASILEQAVAPVIMEKKEASAMAAAVVEVLVVARAGPMIRLLLRRVTSFAIFRKDSSKRMGDGGGGGGGGWVGVWLLGGI